MSTKPWKLADEKKGLTIKKGIIARVFLYLIQLFRIPHKNSILR
jgi:hypothetical protein